MIPDKITVRVTSSGQTVEVKVLNFRAESIEVVLGEDALRHLAPDMATAEDWLSSHHYTGARLEIVGEHEASAETLGQAA